MREGPATSATEPQTTSTVTPAPVARRLARLDLASADLEFGVEFEAAFEDGSTRPVTVRVGSAQTWARAIRFPNTVSEGGQSLGSEAYDDAVRRRAAEVLILVDAAARSLEARCAAA